MMTTTPTLNRKNVLVTGAGGGIGAAITLAFNQAGAKVFATDTDVDSLRQVLKTYPELDDVTLMAMDVTDERNVNEVIKQITIHFGSLNILVNNAGIKSAESLLKGNHVQVKKTLQVNSDSILLCSRVAIATSMGRGGRIINVGSSLSSQGAVFNYQAGGADYCLSKAIVHDLTKLLAFECAPLGINVNAIAPGIIDTPMHGRPREETEARHAGRIPLGRVGEPKDISGLAVFLASSAADYITGQIIHVNGGMLMNG